NAILQLLPVIEQFGGPGRLDQTLERAGVTPHFDATSMVPEMQAARLHRQLRQEEPEMAAHLSSEAGLRTADYILENRIPKKVRLALVAMPARLAAPILSKAIAEHAWTFVGSGKFEVVTPWKFAIHDNPLIRGETSPHPLCHWHVAVFRRLYQCLVHRRCVCVETSCGAQTGGPCKFELRIA
ncbi:MAG: bacteriochlorophyll 4-vinyl reductase, partial [Pseudomonadota bacterium]